MLFMFEIKRMIRGKDWIGMIIGMIVMIIAAIINSIVVQPMFDGNKSIRFDYYCGISQLMPFVFAPSIGNYLTKDYEDYSDFFYSNIKIPFKQYYLTRMLVIILMRIIIISVGTEGYFLKENIEIFSSLNILTILILQYIYVVLVMGIIAYCTQKRIMTIIFTIFGTLFMSVLNILPIPKLQGNLFLLDAHSIVTNNIKEFIVFNNIDNYLNNIVILLVWIFVLFNIYYIMIAHKEKRKERI